MRKRDRERRGAICSGATVKHEDSAGRFTSGWGLEMSGKGMRLRLDTLVDMVLALWITLAAAQHLAVVASALWAGPGVPPADLRPGYWLAGGLLLLGLAARRLSPAKEVSGDR